MNSDVVAIYQSGDTVVIAGRTWAIMREMPACDDTLSHFFVRNGRWDCILSLASVTDVFLDPYTVVDVAYTRSAERVGTLGDLPGLATVSPTVAEYLAQAPPDAPVERIGWEDKNILRCWWISTGSAVTTVLIDGQIDEQEGC